MKYIILPILKFTPKPDNDWYCKYCGMVYYNCLCDQDEDEH